MSKISYSLLGVDQEGNEKVNIDVTVDEVVSFINEALMTGRLIAVSPEEPSGKRRSNFDGDGSRTSQRQREWNTKDKNGKKLQKEIEQAYAPVDTKGMLDEIKFKQVLSSFAVTGMSQETADETGVPLEEVNRAIRFKAYGWYKKGRLKKLGE
jgi:hypothetical protein